jgi:hypothetical protein
MKILYLDENGKTVIPIEGVRGIKLVKSSSNDVSEWSWKYHLYTEQSTDNWHYLPFKSLIAFFDSQGPEDYHIYDYRDPGISDLVMGKEIQDLDEYTKNVL